MPDARAVLDVFVRGLPQPKGSMRPWRIGEKIVVTSAAKGLKGWQSAVSFVLQSAWSGPVMAGAVSVELTFHLLKPRSVPKRRVWPVVKPDIDKLARAVLDGMTGIVFRDDAQVCILLVNKVYADEAGVRVSAAEIVEPR
jgi:crossover junction endodeoxyribonuclease RusA